jgi:hypothetical protein
MLFDERRWQFCIILLLSFLQIHTDPKVLLSGKWVFLLAYFAGLVQCDFSLRSRGSIPPMSGDDWACWQ